MVFSLSALIVIVVLVTARVTLPAGRMLVATILAAIVAIFLVVAVGTVFAASIPNRVRQRLNVLDRRHGIVALDHQLARTERPPDVSLADDEC
jgi:hypothetical protein